MFTSFQEAKDWIEHSIRFGEKLDLVRMNLAAEMLDHPERSFRSIHVAGTNGKGSTTNYIKNILKQAGFKVGIYTSPYVVSFNERIGIDDEYISDEDVVHYANRIRLLWDEIFATTGESVTFFEILTLMAFLYFRDKQVEYAVVEVGLGGLLDATNIITPEISVITNISWDHMKQLGNTLESIAMNKLGIVKQGVPLVTTEENPDLHPLFRETCRNLGSEIRIVDPTKAEAVVYGEETAFSYQGRPYKLHLPGSYQIKNAVLAIETVRLLEERKKFGLTERMIYQGLYETTWPGRFEIFRHNIVLDGAHNIGGAESLKKAVEAVFPNKRIVALFCMMKDKEHDKVIRLLESFVDELHFTQIDYKRSATAEELYQESEHPKKAFHPDFAAALAALKDVPQDTILLITGSLYFVSAIRPLLLAL
jgi:dihydrofolate synthase/folylpolyglutamate synthase